MARRHGGSLCDRSLDATDGYSLASQFGTIRIHVSGHPTVAPECLANAKVIPT